MSLHNLHIEVTDTYQQETLRRPSDAVIMQQPDHLQRYTEFQQRDRNLIRLYLRISKLSNMVDSRQQTKIALHFLDAKRPQNFVPNPQSY